MATTPELTWAVKDSLISYIEALDDGTIDAVEPATRAGAEFRFPGQGAPGDPSLQFFGTVRLTGHWGALNIELRDPRIELDGQRGTLLVRERGGLDPDKFLAFADLVINAADNHEGTIEAAAALTGQGQILLGGQYRVGQELSPIRVNFAPRDE